MEVKATAFEMDAPEKFRAYHTRVELYPPFGKYPTELEAAVLEVEGVTGCLIQRYRLIVAKAPLFEWEHIDPPVIEVLRLFAGVRQVLGSTSFTADDGLGE